MDKTQTQMPIVATLGESFVDFNSPPSPRHLRYMDLVWPTRNGRPEDEPLPDGVIESSGKAMVYVVRHDSLGDNANKHNLARLVRTLACRADAPYLAVVEPGITTVYRVAFYAGNRMPAEETQIKINSEADFRALLNGLGDFEATDTDSVWLDDLLFKLLTSAANSLREVCPATMMDDSRLLSMIGRALFTRFLVDRDIVKKEDLKSVSSSATSAEELFSTNLALAETFSWLDKTFNGDLLDLGTRDYHGLLHSLGKHANDVCRVLSRIMWRSTDGQLLLDWEGLKFKHIPVDVLSQVYEHFAHQYAPDNARKTSIHFTPRSIAEMLVDGAFTALPQETRSRAQVLDPAVGAGVFLVLSLRRIVAEEWLRTGVRPQREKIRQILTHQLCGLDINPQSIKVAALSLYLAALELDPEPQPLSELHFDRLFDTTLRCVAAHHLGNLADAHLGSLSQSLAELGPYDIVLGNPPWTSLSGKDKPLLDLIPCRLGNKRLPNNVGPLVPNQWPDLSFMWCSLKWCKPNGVIALLVNARLLFSQDAFTARKLWFSTTRVTGVLNGMMLRKEEKIWATNSQPFCAIVCVNRAPEGDEAFYFLTPRNEPSLSRRREFRLDPRSAQPVPIAEVISNRTVFKTLARGTSLDLHLVSRLRASSSCTLDQLITMRQGFIAGDNDFQDASSLADYPVLTGNDRPMFAINVESQELLKERFPSLEFHRPREKVIYKGPMLLFREAPKHNIQQRGGIWVNGDLAFSRSFYGTSAVGEKEELARYLYILSYSDLLSYWVLMTSAKFGVERDTYHMEDYKSFPVVPYQCLPHRLRERIPSLSQKIADATEPWEEVESFVAEVYRLNRYDRELVADALTYESPYKASRERGLRYVEAESACVSSFKDALQQVLWAAGVKSVQVETCQQLLNHPVWLFIHIGSSTASRKFEWTTIVEALEKASESLMSSELRIQVSPHDWIIGRMRQERYWTRSMARLLALDLLERNALQQIKAAA